MAKRCSGCRLLPSLSLTAYFTFAIAGTPRNITIDSLSDSIHYSGEWFHANSPLAYHGSHAFSLDPNATASFTFTGIAIYYMAPRWAYDVSTLLTLDSRMSVAVNLTSDSLRDGTVGDLEVENTIALWSQDGLSNTEHTIVASGNGDYVVMDALTYTVIDDEQPPTTPVQVSTIPTGAAPDVPDTVTTLRIMTTSVGVLAACLILAFLFYHRHRKPRHGSMDDSIRNLSPLSWHALKRSGQLSSRIRSAPMQGRFAVAENFPSDRRNPRQQLPTITPPSSSDNPTAAMGTIVSSPQHPHLALPYHLHDSLGLVFEPPSKTGSQDQVNSSSAGPSCVNSKRPTSTHSFASINSFPDVAPHFRFLSGEFGRAGEVSKPATRFYQIPQRQVPENSIHTFTTPSNRRYSSWSFPSWTRKSKASTPPIPQSGQPSGESLQVSPP